MTFRHKRARFSLVRHSGDYLTIMKTITASKKSAPLAEESFADACADEMSGIRNRVSTGARRGQLGRGKTSRLRRPGATTARKRPSREMANSRKESPRKMGCGVGCET